MFNIIGNCYYYMKVKDVSNKMKRTGKKYILPLIVAGSIALGGCYAKEEYNIGNTKIIVKKRIEPNLSFTPTIKLYETKKETEIKYCFDDPNKKLKLYKVKVTEKDKDKRVYRRFNENDSLVIRKAEERSQNLFNIIDSIENKKERERIEFGLNHLENKLE